MKLTDSSMEYIEQTSRAVEKCSSVFGVINFSHRGVYLADKAFVDTFDACEIKPFDEDYVDARCMRNGVLYYALLTEKQMAKYKCKQEGGEKGGTGT